MGAGAATMMPTWVQLIISAAAVVMAVGTLWKVILPGSKLIAEWAAIMPVLRTLVKEFAENPGSLKVLKQISDQFSTDSGSSLRDAINRVEATLQQLEGRWKTLELRDEEDRTRAARLAEQLNTVAATVRGIQGAPPAPLPAPAAPSALPVAVTGPAVVATDVHISGVGVGDKLLVQVEDIQPKKEPQ